MSGVPDAFRWLRDRYRCVALDWRGQGRTPAAVSGYDMDSLADDAAVIEDEGDPHPVLVDRLERRVIFDGLAEPRVG